MLTKAEAQAVVNDLQATIETVFAKHGLDRPKVRTTYGETLRIAITASQLQLDDAGINTASPEAMAYDRYHRSYGLNAGLLGAEVKVHGDSYIFLGIAAKRRKYPIMLRSVTTGKTMLYSTDLVPRLNAANVRRVG